MLRTVKLATQLWRPTGVHPTNFQVRERRRASGDFETLTFLKTKNFRFLCSPTCYFLATDCIIAIVVVVVTMIVMFCISADAIGAPALSPLPYLAHLGLWSG